MRQMSRGTTFRVTPVDARVLHSAVIAPDLRGLADSSKPLTGYDGKTLAEDIHQLVTQLGFKTIFLVGHDIGTQVAYSFAACSSYGSKETSSYGINNSSFRTSW